MSILEHKDVLVYDMSTDVERGSAKPSVHDSDKTESTANVTSGSIQEGTSEYDPTLPMNWPTGKKICNIAVPASLYFVVAFGSSIYAPAVPDVMRDFNVSETAAIVPLTTYVLGLAFGPMLSAPISEPWDDSALSALRFFAGFFGGSPLPVCSGSAADLFAPEYFAIAGSIILWLPFLGPAIGPVVGGFTTQYHGWKWSQYVLAITMVVLWIPVYFLEETYLKIILARRKLKVEAVEGQAKPLASKLLFGILFITLLRPAKILVTEPIVAFLSIYVAFGFAVVFTFFASVPYVFGLVYQFERGNSGLVFLSIALGCTIAVPTIIILDRTTYQKAAQLTSERVAPELRLWPAMYGAIGLPVSLFCFAWTARSDVHWIVPIIAMVAFAWGNLCIYVSTSMYLIDTYAALTAASAIAANGLLRYVLGGTFPLFTTQMYEKLGIAWATSLLGFLSLAMLPIPWVLYVLGARIRRASHFETRKAS